MSLNSLGGGFDLLTARYYWFEIHRQGGRVCNPAMGGHRARKNKTARKQIQISGMQYQPPNIFCTDRCQYIEATGH